VVVKQGVQRLADAFKRGDAIADHVPLDAHRGLQVKVGTAQNLADGRQRESEIAERHDLL